MSAFIAVIFSMVTFEGTNTSNVPTPPVLWKHEKTLTCYNLYVHINNLVVVLSCIYSHKL